MFIVQEVIDGEPQTPQLFTSATIAHTEYNAIVKANGYDTFGPDNVPQHEYVLAQAGDWEAFERDGTNTLVTLYEVEVITKT